MSRSFADSAFDSTAAERDYGHSQSVIPDGFAPIIAEHFSLKCRGLLNKLYLRRCNVGARAATTETAITYRASVHTHSKAHGAPCITVICMHFVYNLHGHMVCGRQMRIDRCARKTNVQLTR